MLFDDIGMGNNTRLLVTTEFNEEEMNNDFYLCLSRDSNSGTHNPLIGTEIYVTTTDEALTLRQVVDIYLSQDYTPWHKEQRTHDFAVHYVENYVEPTRKKTYGRVLGRGQYTKRPRET